MADSQATDQNQNQNQTQNQPTEEQVKAANDKEMSKWQDEFAEDQVTIPYKRDEEDKQDDGGDKPAEDDPASADAPTPDNSQDDVELADPEPIVTVEDPGEFTPQDYSFKVTLADGKKVTIKTPEDAEAIADNPDNFETPKQLMDFINKQSKMVQGIEADKRKWQDQKEQFDGQMEEQTAREERINAIAGEMDYLVKKGLLPSVDDKYKNADWTDPEVAKQPGVKEQRDLLNYMVKENQAREKSGVKPMTSVIDAFNAWQVEQGQSKTETAKKQNAEMRKAAGARVAAVSSSNTQPYVPKGIAVGNPNVFNRGAVWDD